MENYIWYASYGSNLSQSRFSCYLNGGIPEGSLKIETGCKNNAPPLLTQPIVLPYELYFSGYSYGWRGSPAFIDTVESAAQTLGRMYLITDEQFKDVVRQENDDTEEYANILHIGEKFSFPIYTFTNGCRMEDRESGKPSESYLHTLMQGYREAYSLSDKGIASYLIDKNGVAGNYSVDELLEMTQIFNA